MKILQINTIYGSKSTGRTCAEVEKALIQNGDCCITAYGHGLADSKNTYRINTNIEYYIHNILSRITGLEGYFSYFATRRLLRFIEKFKPDIIHLRNLHGHYINLPLLFDYLEKKNIPVIQNLHDCWIYTGKCTHYTMINCKKWMNECNDCPVLKKYPKSYFFDFTKKMRKDKEKWYRKIKQLTVLGVSNWICSEAKKSFFGKFANIKMIYNWINLEIFHPYVEQEITIREKYKIPNQKFIILGVSVSWTKDSPKLNTFLELAKKIEKEDCEFVIIGNINMNNIPQNIIHIPYINNTNELAQLFSISNVYVHCSIEDTFGKVIAEALSCGTPAIVFNSTACPEIIGENCGYVVTSGNIDEMVNKINNIKNNGKEYYKQHCINYVNNNFNYMNNIKKLIMLYKKCLQ